MKKIYSILFAILFISEINAQQTTFQKAFGGSGTDYAYDAHKVIVGGGYIFGGVSSTYPATNANSVNCYIIRTDVNGDTLWTAAYGDTTNNFCAQQYINDICPNSDGGCIAVGGKTVCGDTVPGGNIVRLDANGNILWAKYVTPFADPYPVIQSSDGNFIAGGYETNGGWQHSKHDAFLMKLDATSGDTIWSKRYGGTGEDWFYHILQTTDGGYLAAGKTKSFGQGGEDIYLVKTDANGNLQWSKTYGTTSDEVAFGHCLEPTTDGGYILAGSGSSGGQSPQGIFLMKIDVSGNMNWAKYYPGSEGHAVKQTSDGGYAIVGDGVYTTSGDVVLIKTDSNGNVLWSKTYGGSGAEQGLVLELADDGGYVAGGYTISFGSGAKDLYFIKTDSLGNSGCNEGNPGITSTVAPFITLNAATQVSQGGQTISYPIILGRGGTINNLCSTVAVNEISNNSNDVSVFPNPTNGVFTVTLSGTEGQSSSTISKIEITNLLGEKVYEAPLHLSPKGESVVSLPSGLGQGIYFLHITTSLSSEGGGGIATKKIILNR